MTAPKTVEIALPRFPGFYESDLSHAVDREGESWIEYRCDGGESGPDYESDYPAPLSLADDLASLLFYHTQYDDAYQSLARSWAAAFDYHAGEMLGLTVPSTRRTWTGEAFAVVPCECPSVGIAFGEMESPREYNFTTDRVFGRVRLSTMRDLFNRSAADRHETLSRVIRERFTSRSGFVSFYSNDVRDWVKKPLRDWDHNEYGTLLWAALEIAGGDLDCREYYSGFFADVRKTTLENDGAHDAWCNAVDWPAFEAARAEMRVERLAAWLLDDGDAARAWIAANPDHVSEMRQHAGPSLAALLGEAARCPDTVDMFAS
jgi:hypothetical protein